MSLCTLDHGLHIPEDQWAPIPRAQLSVKMGFLTNRTFLRQQHMLPGSKFPGAEDTVPKMANYMSETFQGNAVFFFLSFDF